MKRAALETHLSVINIRHRWHLVYRRPKPASDRANIVTALRKLLGKVEWIEHTEPLAVFDIDDEAGEGTARIVTQERFAFADGTTANVLGTYNDRYVQTTQRWQFAERTLDVIERS